MTLRQSQPNTMTGQQSNIPLVLDREYIARTLRTLHSVEHGRTDFWACSLQPCSKIGALQRRLVETELKEIYESLSEARRDFDQICADGSSPFLLYAYLNVAAFGRARINHSIWDLYRVSPSAWKRLSIKVEDLAGEIEAFTQNRVFSRFLTDYWRSSVPAVCPIDELPGMIRRQLYTCQHLLPLLLREFARSLRQPLVGIKGRIGPKRWDTGRQGILDLLWYVRASTGKPHWDAVANVLDHFAAQCAPDCNAANTVDADALRKLWKRARKYRTLPTGA